ncbi:MAG: hypothetical protein PUB96_06890 [Helicobacteraceae bacterium]|nr:hypothetical protein [Helicobacteraceae bacterium]
MSYKIKKRIAIICGQDLERVVKENKVLRGEYAIFKIVGQEVFEILKNTFGMFCYW